LNHTESQKERGGHIVCFENEKLHNIMKEAIISTDGDISPPDEEPTDDNSKSFHIHIIVIKLIFYIFYLFV
jgi:hypothetical protein